MPALHSFLAVSCPTPLSCIRRRPLLSSCHVLFDTACAHCGQVAGYLQSSIQGGVLAKFQACKEDSVMRTWWNLMALTAVEKSFCEMQYSTIAYDTRDPVQDASIKHGRHDFD